MKMDTPSETSISWGGIFSSALARNVSLGNKISTIEAKQKLLGRSVAFVVKSVRKHLIGQNFFELMTPTPHGKRYMFRESNCKSNNVTSLKWSQITRNGSRWHVN